MKLKKLKQFLSFIKDDNLDVSIQLGDNIAYLDVLMTNRGDIVLSNKSYEQCDEEIKQVTMSTIFKLNDAYMKEHNFIIKTNNYERD